MQEDDRGPIRCAVRPLIAERDTHRVLRFTAVVHCAKRDGSFVVVGDAVPGMCRANEV
jgi:hypothetical protein